MVHGIVSPMFSLSPIPHGLTLCFPRLYVTVPTLGLHIGINVAPVTKLRFIGVTPHTCAYEAHRMSLAVSCPVCSLSCPDHAFLPSCKKVDMVCAHIRSRLHALLFVDRSFQFRNVSGTSPYGIIPEGTQYNNYEYCDPHCDLTCIVHL